MTGSVPEVVPDVESWTRGIAWTEVDENPLDAKVPVPYRVPPVAKIPTPRIATMNSQTGIPLFEAVKRMINPSFHAFPCYSLMCSFLMWQNMPSLLLSFYLPLFEFVKGKGLESSSRQHSYKRSIDGLVCTKNLQGV